MKMRQVLGAHISMILRLQKKIISYIHVSRTVLDSKFTILDSFLVETCMFVFVEYGMFLEEKFEDFEGAKKAYYMAKDEYGERAGVLFPLADLLDNVFDEFDEAKEYYIKMCQFT